MVMVPVPRAPVFAAFVTVTRNEAAQLGRRGDVMVMLVLVVP